jgi:hypothetical protein
MALLSRRLPTFLDIASVGLLAVAVWLFWSRRPAAEAPAALAAVPSRIVPGAVLRPFEAVDSAGRVAPALASSGARLLLLFRSDCPACAAQRPEWEALARDAAAAEVGASALTPEPLTGAVAGYFGGAPVEVRRFADAGRAAEALDLRVVPTTLLVDDGGRVVFHHQGILPPAARDSLRAALAAVRPRAAP